MRKKLNEKLIDIVSLIGEFYLRKNDNDYVKTSVEIKQLKITEIKLDDKSVLITLKRPGLLIGKRGENIDKLEKFLSMKVKIFETENSELDYLIPEPPYEENIDDIYYLIQN